MFIESRTMKKKTLALFSHFDRTSQCEGDEKKTIKETRFIPY